MLQLLLAVAFSGAPLTLYVPPVRSLNLFVDALEAFARQTADYSGRVLPRACLGLRRIIAALRRVLR